MIQDPTHTHWYYVNVYRYLFLEGFPIVHYDDDDDDDEPPIVLYELFMGFKSKIDICYKLNYIQIYPDVWRQKVVGINKS